MRKNYFRYYKNNIVVPVILITGTIIGVIVKLLLPLINGYLSEPYLQYPSITILLGSLVLFIDVFLWKYKPFKWLFWIDDFSGRYEGEIHYQYRDENGIEQSGSLRHVKIIKQTGSKICVSSFTYKDDKNPSSMSVNKGMHVEKTDCNEHYRLIYNYLNDGSTKQGFPTHYGTEVIKFNRNGNEKFLSGNYYTDRLPFQTKGEFKNMKWIDNNLKHDF